MSKPIPVLLPVWARWITAAVVCVLLSPVIHAQNSGGVFGPVVDDGHVSAQYRASYDPYTDGFAQRVHYQRAVNSDLMWRLVVVALKTSDADVDFDSIRGELFWDLGQDGAAYRTGLRFDVVLRDEDRAHSAGLNWTNQFALGDKWSGRAVFLTAVQLGDNANNGVFVGSRAQLARALAGGKSAGLQWFSSYGSTDDLSGFDDQVHQVGPYFSSPVVQNWSLRAGVLLGVTEASADTNYRIWITRSF